MNEEEKKAIEDLKEEIKGAEYEGHGKDRIVIELKTILNLIEKQSKEIEELKEKSNHITKETVEFVNSHYIHKSEIKAKIEEIDEVLKGQLIEKIRVYFEAQKEVLQSLLEKE